MVVNGTVTAVSDSYYHWLWRLPIAVTDVIYDWIDCQNPRNRGMGKWIALQTNKEKEDSENNTGYIKISVEIIFQLLQLRKSLVLFSPVILASVYLMLRVAQHTVYTTAVQMKRYSAIYIWKPRSQHQRRPLLNMKEQQSLFDHEVLVGSHRSRTIRHSSPRLATKSKAVKYCLY